VICLQRGHLAAAAALTREAVRARPDFTVAYNTLSVALRRSGLAQEAEASCREALRLDPDYAEAHNNRGAALRELGDFAGAEACCRAALRLEPDYAEARNNLGAVLAQLGRLEEAEGCWREALRLNPQYAAAHNNLGSVLASLRRPREALAHFARALAISPDYVGAHCNLAVAHLLLGDFENGWREDEWRWLAPVHPRRFAQPLWTGEEIGKRVLFLHNEQGFGDTIQFCRYAPLAAAKGRVILAIPRQLGRLLSSLHGVERVIVEGDQLPDFDLHCPLLSLPRAFGTRLETIPASVPYLAAPAGQVTAWRQRLAELPGLRVGLAWASNPHSSQTAAAAMDRRRKSMALDQFARLAGVQGVSFVSLQKGEAAGQTLAPPPGLAIRDWTTELEDFADTAALIEALDLVISVDTAVAHLAGALAKPVWLLNRFDACWRWLLDRDDSPWYPSLRQFRQSAPGDWDSVIARAARELAHRATAVRE